MQDVVLEFVVSLGDEARMFADYFQTFVDRAFIDAMLGVEVPLVILRSLPADGHELKEVVFQHATDAQAFASGWLAALAEKGLI